MLHILLIDFTNLSVNTSHRLLPHRKLLRNNTRDLLLPTLSYKVVQFKIGKPLYLDASLKQFYLLHYLVDPTDTLRRHYLGLDRFKQLNRYWVDSRPPYLYKHVHHPNSHLVVVAPSTLEQCHHPFTSEHTHVNPEPVQMLAQQRQFMSQTPH